MDWSNDNCPVCNGQAKEALPRMGDFAEIICKDCGRYRISGSALEVIRYEPADTRSRALMRAAKRGERDGVMPKIMHHDLTDGGVDGGGG